MQFKAALLALFVAAASAQDLSKLPPCARPCFEDNFPKSGCDKKTDFKCLCGSDKYINAVTSCVIDKCPTDKALAARKWAEATCKKAGNPID